MSSRWNSDDKNGPDDALLAMATDGIAAEMHGTSAPAPPVAVLALYEDSHGFSVAVVWKATAH